MISKKKKKSNSTKLNPLKNFPQLTRPSLFSPQPQSGTCAIPSTHTSFTLCPHCIPHYRTHSVPKTQSFCVCSPGTAVICSSHADTAPQSPAVHPGLELDTSFSSSLSDFLFPEEAVNSASALPPGSHLSSHSTPCYPGPTAHSHKEALWAQEHGSCSCTLRGQVKMWPSEETRTACGGRP